LMLGQQGERDREDLIREIDDVEKTITTLIGKNTLPRFPFIVLSILECQLNRSMQHPLL